MAGVQLCLDVTVQQIQTFFRTSVLLCCLCDKCGNFILLMWGNVELTLGFILAPFTSFFLFVYWLSSKMCISFAALTWGSHHNTPKKKKKKKIHSSLEVRKVMEQRQRNQDKWHMKNSARHEGYFWLIWVKWQASGQKCETLMGLASEVGLRGKMKSLWSWLSWWMKRCAHWSVTDSGKALELSPHLIKK